MTDREALLELIDAMLRKNTERDGNWGYMSFHNQLRSLQDRLSPPPAAGGPLKE